MANFNKSPLKANEKLMPYSEGLENRIEEGFNDVDNGLSGVSQEVNDHDSKIMNLLSWMGLVEDYVIESSSNSTMKWNKWENGLAILTISKRIDLYDTEDEVVTLPFPFVGYPTVYFGSQGGTNAAFRKALLGLIGYVDGTSLTIGKTVRSAGSQADNQTITIIGFWK